MKSEREQFEEWIRTKFPEHAYPDMLKRRPEKFEGEYQSFVVEIAWMSWQEARRTVPREAAPDAWRPFETAPKDGTRVLLWGPKLLHSGAVVAAKWLKHDIEYWHVDDGKFGPFPLRGPDPTHWSPTPATPAEAAAPAETEPRAWVEVRLDDGPLPGMGSIYVRVGKQHRLVHHSWEGNESLSKMAAEIAAALGITVRSAP